MSNSIKICFSAEEWIHIMDKCVSDVNDQGVMRRQFKAEFVNILNSKLKEMNFKCWLINMSKNNRFIQKGS